MPQLFTLAELEAASRLVAATIPPTPAYRWPLLKRRAGLEVVVKHENHTPIGAFKVRGGLVYMDELTSSGEKIAGVISATRGNHGQSIALAATAAGIAATIVVPAGNSVEKNAAMRALGAELIEHGDDFEMARLEAERLGAERRLHMLPSYHPWLVKGVATYALELFRAIPDLDTVYAPIGMGSGISGLIQARDLLGLRTEIVGVVAENAPAVALSFAAGAIVPTNSARTFADGMATRQPHPLAMDVIRAGASRIVQVSEDEIAEAIRALYQDTHNVAEGAGAASLAALLKEGRAKAGQRAGVILSGGNIDTPMLATVLGGRTPVV